MAPSTLIHTARHVLPRFNHNPWPPSNTTSSAGMLHTFLDLVRNAFPPNVVEATFRAQQSAPDPASAWGYSLKVKESMNTVCL